MMTHEPSHEPDRMIYSPTFTQDWLRCPIYATWNHTLTPHDAKPSPAMLIGRALHAAVAEFYLTGESLGEEALTILTEWVETDEWPAAAVFAVYKKALKGALPDAQAIRDAETIIAVEKPIGECRVDLVTRDRRGDLIVRDLKFQLDVKAEWLPKRLAGFRTSHQLLHYAWAVSEYYAEPVVWYGVQLVVGAPRALSKTVLYRCTPEQLAFWLRGAEHAWEDITRRKDAPYPNPFSCDGKYGACPLIPFCWDLGQDTTKAVVLYNVTP